MITLKNISIRFGDFSLRNIAFSVAKGEYFVMLGESGVGKSLILEIIAGLTPADGGTVHVDGTDVTRVPIQKRNIGLVYQDQALFPHMSVRRNLEFPLKCRGLGTQAMKERVEFLAEKTGITHLLDRKSETLSVGEAQRTALARTLATQPKVLLLDEPLASLDVQAKVKMRSFLRKLNREGQTIIHVTHDYEEAFALADKIAVLENGVISQGGTPDDVFQRPKSEFVANFIGIKNFYRGSLSRKSEDLAVFSVGNLDFEVTTDASDGDGNLVIDSKTITVTRNLSESSARNCFKGTITDLEPAKSGIEVHVDIGVPITAMVTRESREEMDLKQKDTVWLSFKASAVQFMGSEEKC